MDPLSLAASITTLCCAAFRVVVFLGDIKIGGKERLKLFTEINSLWMVLKVLEEQFHSDDLHKEETRLQGVQSLLEPDGVFNQINDELQKLMEKLEPHSGAQKVIQTLKWPFDRREIDRTIKHLERFKQSISIVLTHANLALSQEIRDDGVKVRIKSIIDWLSPLNFLAKQEAIFKESREGTGTWLLDSKIFTSWASAAESILWCPGIPGAGKTFLASIIVDRLRQLYRAQNAAVLMIYCSYNDSSNQSPGDLIASLLKQINQTRPI